MRRAFAACPAPGIRPLFHARRPTQGFDLCGDLLYGGVGPLPRPAGGGWLGVLVLAGSTGGASGHGNADVALSAWDWAKAQGAHRLFYASTQAVYAPGSSDPDERAARRRDGYGGSKALAEDLLLRAAKGPTVCVLRLGNVAGADSLAAGLAAGRVVLDRFADGAGPQRSYVGARDLAAGLIQLAQLDSQGRDIPSILNLAAPGAVSMESLARAAGASVAWRTAPDGARQRAVMDTRLAETMLDLRPSDPSRLVQDAGLVRAGKAA